MLTFLLLLPVQMAVVSGVRAQSPQAPSNQRGWYLGGEIGAWKPVSLGTEGALSPKILPGTKPYYGASIAIPLRQQVHALVSAGHWQQTDFSPTSPVDRLDVWPLFLVVRHQLSDVSAITPFVDFGVLGLWGVEKRLGGERTIRKRTIGVCVGAGIELFLSRHLVLLGKFQYVYARFNDRIGETDNYSGPFLSAGVLFGL